MYKNQSKSLICSTLQHCELSIFRSFDDVRDIFGNFQTLLLGDSLGSNSRKILVSEAFGIQSCLVLLQQKIIFDATSVGAPAANANKSNDTMFEFFFFCFYIHYFLKVGQSMLSRLLFMYYLQKVKWYKWLTSQKNKKHSREELRRKKQCNVSRPILMKLETQMLTTKNNLLFHEAED